MVDRPENCALRAHFAMLISHIYYLDELGFTPAYFPRITVIRSANLDQVIDGISGVAHQIYTCKAQISDAERFYVWRSLYGGRHCKGVPLFIIQFMVAVTIWLVTDPDLDSTSSLHQRRVA
jgi:hypothetical protein